MLVALFGITNDGLNLFVNLVVLFLVVVWIALVAWTYLDARRRIQDPVLVACATGASLFPFVGTIVYTILRPPEFLEDARERELEIRAAELRVRQLEEQSCPNCGYPIERTYLRCPDCRARVKDPCESCQKPIDPRWTICPYCETPQRRAAPSRAASRAAPRGAPAGRRERAGEARRARSEARPRARRPAGSQPRPAQTPLRQAPRPARAAPLRRGRAAAGEAQAGARARSDVAAAPPEPRGARRRSGPGRATGARDDVGVTAPAPARTGSLPAP